MPSGADGDDRSQTRRSFDELMESRRAESRAVWRAFLGPLLSLAEVQDLLGAPTTDDVDALVNERRLLALPTHEGDVVYPAFQFRADGTPYPVIRHVIEILGPVAVTPYTIASWLMSPKPYFQGTSPIHWLVDDPDEA